jgi:excisionase family DNA binding protein
MGEIVTLDEAAAFLAVDRSTVWRMIRDGRLSEHWVAGPRKLGVDLDEVRAKLHAI